MTNSYTDRVGSFRDYPVRPVTFGDCPDAGSRRRRARLHTRIVSGDPTVVHGSLRTYRAGCGCADCTEEASERRALARERARTRARRTVKGTAA